MRSLIRLLRGGRRSLPPQPPSRRPTMPSTPMGQLRYNSMNGDREYWWTAQDQDPAWARQWEGDTDTTNPKDYK